MDEIVSICDHIIFNSFSQLAKFKDKALQAGCKVGLRVNPECSTQEGHEIYDPCSPGSRFGAKQEDFRAELLEGVSGLHFHTLCQQNSDDLETTLNAVVEKFGQWLPQMEWINFGGDIILPVKITTFQDWKHALNGCKMITAWKCIWSREKQLPSMQVIW